MSTKAAGTPQGRKLITDRLLDAYRQSGVITAWTWDMQSRRWVINMPNGTMLIYGPMQVEAFTQGVQALAYRLCLSPLDPRDPTIPDGEYDALMREAHEDDDRTAPNDHSDADDEPPF